MIEDIKVYMDKYTGGSYLESLIASRRFLSGQLLTSLDEVITVEIELALMGATKAKSEVLKKTTDTVRPIK